jgi:hypothetical protein
LRYSKVVHLGFLDRSLLIYPHEAEWTKFQAYYYLENLVEPEIEPGTFGFVVRNAAH